MQKQTKRLLLTFAMMIGLSVSLMAKDVYLFSYFRGERSGLHLAYSYDGKTWTALNDNQPLMAPTVGKDKLMRDPSIVQGPDGTFHMVWTSSWYDQIIGYASSKDLINWSEQVAIPVMKDEPTAKNSWAPELFYDEPSKIFYIFWATTIPDRHSYVPTSESEKQWNHRIYCTTTKDFKTFTKTRMFFNPTFSAIDAAIAKDPVTNELIMVVKNENSAPAEKNIRVTRTTDIRKGFPVEVSAPITGNYWAEGPAPLYVGDTLFVYFDMYRNKRYGAVCSTDHGHTWTDISDQVSFPQGIRHGTAFKVDERYLNTLLKREQKLGATVKWDDKSLIWGGLRVVPAMGEIHYSRIPAAEWQQEVKQMKEGGVSMIACYVFWNHIEEIEGQYDWSGQRDLRTFLEICKEEQLPVVLRVGPFCHGEVRNGGIPDWVFAKGCRTRSEDKVFLSLTERYYRQIFTQIQGLQWKDGGPVVAAQFDNEYRGKGSYLMALKDIAKQIGFDLPFYTRTGWPELSTPVPFGEMIPLYGDYADGFWDRSIKEGVGDYYKAFNFHEGRTSSAIASEQLTYNTNDTQEKVSQYPYFTCELGGGMMTSYHRRVYLYPEDAYSMAIVKLGSGSNLLGYYMYHGGTNPDGKLTYLNETQKTIATNYNDLPVKTYDFQAPLNEFGQRNPHFYLLRKLHLFINDYATELAPMHAVCPNPQNIRQGEDSFLRWSYREKDGSAFVFINNYERFQNLSAKKDVQFEVCGVKFPQKPITIPANTACVFPVNIDGIRYATAQLVARREGKVYMQQISGIPTEIAIDGKVLKNLKPKGVTTPVYRNIYLIDAETAGRLFLEEPEQEKQTITLSYKKIREAAPSRTITTGANKVAEEPTDADFEQAAVYTIDIPVDRKGLLCIQYYGDCARLYDGDTLIDDNFYNGREFQYGLWRLPAATIQLTLRILPIQPDMPVYYPREAGIKEMGERIKTIMVKN